MSEVDSRTPEMVPLVSDLDYYAKAYRAYAGFSEQKLKIYQKWAGDVFSPAVVENLKASLPDIEELRVLGVGSGSGEIDMCLLERLSPAFPRINNTVIEPSPEAISKYTASVAQNKDAIPGVTCRFLQTTIQEFRKETKMTGKSKSPVESQSKFHLIHTVQSLYYTSDLEGAILDLYESLEEDGVLLIIMMTDEHVIYRMWDNFKFISSKQSGGMTNLSSKDIIKALERLGLACRVDTVTLQTERSSFFDANSIIGNMILDFLTHTVNFRVTAPAQLREEVFSFLRSICSSGRDGDMSEDLDNNRLFLNRNWQSIIVYKTSKSGS